MSAISPPDRRSRPHLRQALTKLAAQPARTDNPAHLPLAEIKQQPGLFQPRFDSVAYAPGRSEGHIANLARAVRNGAELDPVAIIPFANVWYLVDGHHRLEAYKAAGRITSIPVEVRHSDLMGPERVTWAIQESVRDNKKNRLAMSDTDKMDAAWAAVARGDELSIHETAVTYGVSERSVASMRKARAAMEDAGGAVELAASWQEARRELRRLSHDDGADQEFPDLDARRRREAAKRLKGAMDLRLPPGILADALEAYEPGIVEMMALALRAAREADEAWQGEEEELLI